MFMKSQLHTILLGKSNGRWPGPFDDLGLAGKLPVEAIQVAKALGTAFLHEPLHWRTFQHRAPFQ